MHRLSKWMGLALSAAIALCWIANLRWNITLEIANWDLGIRNGAVFVQRNERKHGMPNKKGIRVGIYPASGWSDLALRPQRDSWEDHFYQITAYHVPLWMPFGLFTITTACLWHLDRHPAPGKCRCGYDLTGNTSGRCPECGRIAPECPVKTEHS